MIPYAFQPSGVTARRHHYRSRPVTLDWFTSPKRFVYPNAIMKNSNSHRRRSFLVLYHQSADNVPVYTAPTGFPPISRR